MSQTQIPKPPKQSDQPAPAFTSLEAPNIADVLKQIDEVDPAEPTDSRAVQLLTKLRAFLSDPDNWMKGSLVEHNVRKERNQYCLVGAVGMVGKKMHYPRASHLNEDSALFYGNNYLANAPLYENQGDPVPAACWALNEAAREIHFPRVFGDAKLLSEEAKQGAMRTISIPNFNDNNATTHADIMLAVDRAIEIIREREKENK